MRTQAVCSPALRPSWAAPPCASAALPSPAEGFALLRGGVQDAPHLRLETAEGPQVGWGWAPAIGALGPGGGKGKGRTGARRRDSPAPPQVRSLPAERGPRGDPLLGLPRTRPGPP